MLSDLEALPGDCLETIGCDLDYKSAMNILLTSKTLRQKLNMCGKFWRHICKTQAFDDYLILKKEEEFDKEENSKNFFGKEFRNLDLWNDDNEPTPPLWRRIYLRGVAMKRNICRPSFRLSRLYLTDKDNLAVKELRHDTGERELRKLHRRSKAYKKTRHRGRGERYWTEEYFLSMQGRTSRNYYEIFVWSWESGRNVEFLYSIDMVKTYPGGLFPTTFYIWKDYFVTLPLDPLRNNWNMDSDKPKCIIRVHDLRNQLEVVSEYCLPKDTIFAQPPGEMPDTFHLLPMDQEDTENNKAVVLLRTTSLCVYIFSVPDSTLLFTSLVPVLTEINSRDVIDQTKAAQNGVLYFWLQRMEGLFLDDEAMEQAGIPTDDYIKLLQVDCRNFASTGAPVFRICQEFENRQCMMESISFISTVNEDGSKSEDILSVTKDGTVLWREIACVEDTLLMLTKRQILIDNYIKQASGDDDEEEETDAPVIEYNKLHNLIIVFRHLTTGRKIHAYNDKDQIVYTIDVDDKVYELTHLSNYICIDVFRNFIGVADRERIVIYKAETGQHCSTIQIPKHYVIGGRQDSLDKYVWKGNEISFSEDGIVVNHNHWDYPATADIIAFW